eukprot:CAMPEP_0181495622 /NCGR_PEP_ID=MMETSP1110-20121109/52491_1 /TAXON_ID=174948 /ORGANISM="Symbiodinium sp., Strain CCMP421" /LENGTH=50 /DNA_ID=CAMNT_0023623289 /DNA_START=70 /DNA_END=219 /DNA_ORIENTATION=-
MSSHMEMRRRSRIGFKQAKNMFPAKDTVRGLKACGRNAATPDLLEIANMA